MLNSLDRHVNRKSNNADNTTIYFGFNSKSVRADNVNLAAPLENELQSMVNWAENGL